MVCWQKVCLPGRNSYRQSKYPDVANYIKSIHGTSPPNPKEPQGTKVEEGDKLVANNIK
jgi:hypothetical protein